MKMYIMKKKLGKYGVMMNSILNDWGYNLLMNENHVTYKYVPSDELAIVLVCGWEIIGEF